MARRPSDNPSDSAKRGRLNRERAKRGVENFGIDAASDWRDILIRLGHLDERALDRCANSREERKLVAIGFGSFLAAIHDRFEDESISAQMGRVRLDVRRVA